jgi:hypothetical protein
VCGRARILGRFPDSEEVWLLLAGLGESQLSEHPTDLVGGVVENRDVIARA